MKTKLVIFGLTGDLGKRKLIPALDFLLDNYKLSLKNLEIIGVSRREINSEKLLSESLGKKETKLKNKINFLQMNLSNIDDYKKLKMELKPAEQNSQIFLYLSVPPNSAAQISELAGKAGINSPNVKILFEKPFGIDLLSAQDFLAKTHKFFTEKQIFRVDHYLMKESVRAQQALFEKNEILRNLRNENQIKQIEIIATEQIDIENRGIFYEQTGALRDFVQNHLASIFAAILAEDNPDFRASRAEVLENVTQIFNFSEQAVRAQYFGYKNESNSAGSNVETFAKITLVSKNEKWKNTQITLVSGKALNSKKSEILIHFNNKKSKALRININENSNGAPPYSQVFLDAFSGKKQFFVSEDEILASWRIFDPILKKWEFDAENGLLEYKKNSNWREI